VLSAHEFATLMLVKDSADHIADRAELGTLLERQLVALEQRAGGTVRPRITEDGRRRVSSPSPRLYPLMGEIGRVPLRTLHRPTRNR